MFVKKMLAMMVLPFLLAAFLHSQSLAELAKKEKERREALKGKSTTVITNADLTKVKKRPAVESAEAELVEAEELAEQVGEEDVPPPATVETAEAEEQAGDLVIPAEPPALTEKEIQMKQNELIDLAAEKQEMVELLTMKMNALYQEYYGLDTLKSREILQIQISDTYDKLLKAEADAAKARQEVEDFIAANKKEATPSIWIR
jgi:hypothetical protein